MVVIKMADGREMKLELYPDFAPITVANFENHAKNGLYNGTMFHRVISGFMIQGGAPVKTDSIKGEFKNNGVPNPILHEKGVISMARSEDPNSAGNQFFIVHEPCLHLDENFAAFGRVVEGLDVLDDIAAVKTGMRDKPLVDQVVESIIVV